VGLALYRAGEVSGTDPGWSLYSDNLAQSWQKAEKIGYDGYALFRYAWFDMDIAAKELENLKQTDDMDDAGRVSRIIDEITEIAYFFVGIS
jgi:hypothetical protein